MSHSEDPSSGTGGIHQKEVEFMDSMKEYISAIIMSAKECNCIQKLTFYIFHANYIHNQVLHNDEFEYYPIEICVARCSLKNGIEDVYHDFICDKVRNGCRNEVLSYMNETQHQFPINFPEGKDNYQEVFRDLCKFLEPGKENHMLPPLYTIRARKDVYYPAKIILHKLFAAGGEHKEHLRLYALEDLFVSMYNAVLDRSTATNFETITLFNELNKNPHYKSGFECDFHKRKYTGAIYCSKSIIRKWFYELRNFCCEPLNITKLPGVHTSRKSLIKVVKLGALKRLQQSKSNKLPVCINDFVGRFSIRQCLSTIGSSAVKVFRMIVNNSSSARHQHLMP